MPPALALASPAVLVAGALAVLVARGRIRQVTAATAWLAVLAGVGGWIAEGRVPTDLALLAGQGAGSLNLEMNAVTVTFGLAVLVPAALLFTFQERRRDESMLALWACAAAITSIEAAGIFGTALALGAAATLLMVMMGPQDRVGPRAVWGSQMAAGLLLILAAALLASAAGTSIYSAIPSGALSGATFGLLAGAGLLVSGLVPGRGWPAQVWLSPKLAGGAMTVAVSTPLGLNLLARTYSAGSGSWPSPWFHLTLGLIGTATALAAALRAQAAPQRRICLAEMVPLSAGLALAAIALGTPLGVAAGISAVFATASLAAVLPLLPESNSGLGLLGLAVAAGAPPGLVFGARLLSLEAAFESGTVPALIALVAASAWLLSIAALARCVWLPATDPPRGVPDSRLGSAVGVVLSVAAGVVLGGIESALVVPATALLVRFPAGVLTGGWGLVSTASGEWPALELALPTLVLVALAALLGGPRLGHHGGDSVSPLLGYRLPSGVGALTRARSRLAELGGVFGSGSMGAALGRSQPWLWVVVVVVLAIAVTR
ncbi:MAG TPA: hypothetical protein VMU49_06805 [Candidatus Acidoferrales bacterium]|nr:hypothetical protein [Candidatus Acidoferrales bacterium]